MPAYFLRFFVPAVLLVGIVAPSLPAIAQTRVVVQAFRGPRAGQIRGHVVAALSNEGSIEVVPRSEVQAAAQELGFSPGSLTEEGYTAVAQQLNVSAFIRGRVSRRRRRWSATAVVINGADGTELGRRSWSGRTVSSLGAMRRNAYGRLEPYLSAASSPAPAEATADPGQGEGAWWNGGEGGEGEGGEEEEEEEESEPIDPGSRFDWLSFELLIGTNHRWMEAHARVLNNDRDPGGPAELDEIRRYNSAGLGHGEIGFRVGFFPGAVPDDQPVPWFGAFLELRHSLGLTSRGCPQVGACAVDSDRIDIGTSQFEVYIGAQGRYRFGDERGAPMITADVGYGIFGFNLELDDLALLERPSVIAPTQHNYLHLGVGIEYAFVPVYFTAGTRLAYRAGFGVGNDARAVWGIETGGSSGVQFAIDLRTEMPYIAEGVFLGLTFDYFAFSTTYRGQTACRVEGCADTDPWEPWPYDPANRDDVTGGIAESVTDNYMRLFFRLGYAFH